MKSFLSSKVCVGALLSVVSFALSATGRKVDSDQLQGLVSGVQELWPLLTGIALSFVGFWTRIKGFQWERPNWKEGHFWASLGVASVAIGNVLNVPTDDLGHAFEQIGALAATGKVTSLLTAGLMIAGSILAKKKVEIRRASIVPLALILPFTLCQCAAFNRLSPETQALIEQKAIAAATAAESSALQGVIDGKKAKDIARDAGKAALEAVKTQPVEVLP